MTWEIDHRNTLDVVRVSNALREGNHWGSICWIWHPTSMGAAIFSVSDITWDCYDSPQPRGRPVDDGPKTRGVKT